MTRNGVAAGGSMLGLFSERLLGRLRREPGLSWGDSVNRGKERVSTDNQGHLVRPSYHSHPGSRQLTGPHKTVQPLWKIVWQFTKKLKTELPHGPAMPLLGIYPQILLFIAA